MVEASITNHATSQRATDRHMVGQLAQLAEFVSKPLAFVHDDHIQLPRHVVRSLSGPLCFQGPINRAISRTLALSQLPFSQELRGKLETNEEMKTVVFLLNSDLALIMDLARHCAAVQLFPQLRSCVVRQQREIIEAMLGPGVFMFSMREALAFYPSLPERSQALRLADLEMTGENAPEISDQPASRQSTGPISHLVWEGLATLIAFTRLIDPACAKLLSLRFPKAPDTCESAKLEVTEKQAKEIKALIKRRKLRW